MKRKFYLAYGANTNHESMKWRCPLAEFICNVTLPNMRLVFRGVADVVDAQQSEVHCAVLSITEDCEAALDRFEGFPRLYVKRYLNVSVLGVKHRAMIYVMRNPQQQQALPGTGYEDCLRLGYQDCGLPEAQIDEAIARVKNRAERVRLGELPPELIRERGQKPVFLYRATEETETTKSKPLGKSGPVRIITPQYLKGQLPLPETESDYGGKMIRRAIDPILPDPLLKSTKKKRKADPFPHIHMARRKHLPTTQKSSVLPTAMERAFARAKLLEDNDQ